MVIVRNTILLRISKADEDILQMYQIATSKIPVTKTFSVLKNKKNASKKKFEIYNRSYLHPLWCILKNKNIIPRKFEKITCNMTQPHMSGHMTGPQIWNKTVLNEIWPFSLTNDHSLLEWPSTIRSHFYMTPFFMTPHFLPLLFWPLLFWRSSLWPPDPLTITSCNMTHPHMSGHVFWRAFNCCNLELF